MLPHRPPNCTRDVRTEWRLRGLDAVRVTVAGSSIPAISRTVGLTFSGRGTPSGGIFTEVCRERFGHSARASTEQIYRDVRKEGTSEYTNTALNRLFGPCSSVTRAIRGEQRHHPMAAKYSTQHDENSAAQDSIVHISTHQPCAWFLDAST